jgi:hypothetical protein
MTCKESVQIIDKTIQFGDKAGSIQERMKHRRLIYFRVGEANIIMIGCEIHTDIALRRYRLGMDLERQHGG